MTLYNRSKGHSVSENVLQTAQQLIQDVIAPDVRELKVRAINLEKDLDALRKYMEHLLELLDRKVDAVDRKFEPLEKRIDRRFDDAEEKSELRFKAILAALSESRTQAELTSVRLMASLSERVALLEARHQ